MACDDMCGTTERGASAVQAERRAAEAVEELCKKTHLVRPIAAVERHERDARAPAHGEPLHESAARRMPEIPFPAGERGIARALGNARPELVRPDPLERQIITAHYGLDGQPARSMKQLHADLGVPRADLRQALGTGLAKLRSELG